MPAPRYAQWRLMPAPRYAQWAEARPALREAY